MELGKFNMLGTVETNHAQFFLFALFLFLGSCYFLAE